MLATASAVISLALVAYNIGVCAAVVYVGVIIWSSKKRSAAMTLQK